MFKRIAKKLAGAAVALAAVFLAGSVQAASWIDGTVSTALSGDAALTATDLVELVGTVGGVAMGIWGAYQVFGIVRRAFASGKGR